MTSDGDLLRSYAEAKPGAEDAFTELVRRHVDLVYSAALRQVNGDAHLAQDVSQTVFSDLARKAAPLSSREVLTGWLYTSTRFVASNAVRTEQRRRIHEQEANSVRELLIDSGPELDWATLRPVLDTVMHELDESDREAILLRFFENRRFGEIGQKLGWSEDATRKRVDRALEKLREHLTRQGITTTATALSVVIAANAVQAAPVGLASAISAAAVVAGALPASTIVTATKIVVMTTLQKALIASAFAVVAGLGLYEAYQTGRLREQNKVLREQQALLAEQLQQLRRERDDAAMRLAASTNELAREKRIPSEVLKLRSEVGALRQEKAASADQSVASKALSDPETRKVIRERNKSTITAIYSDLAKRLKLTPEQTGNLNELLTDHSMESVGLVTQALHDHSSQAEVRQVFSEWDAAFQEKVRAELGDAALAQYQDYTKNLGSTLFVAGFERSLTGDPATLADKKARLLQAFQEETQSAITAAGLPADYQTVVMMNPRNIASEDEAAQNVKMKDDIFGKVAARASNFLTADELTKFQQATTSAMKNAESFILMERKLMGPVSQ